MNKLPLLVLWLLAYCLRLPAQQEVLYKHQVLGLGEGLSSEVVNCGLQDNRGFLWLGTSAGLDRFDGKHFQLIGKKNGLWSDQISSLAKDEQGNIWVTYSPAEGHNPVKRRIDVVNPATLEILPLGAVFKNLPFDDGQVFSMEQDGEGGIYLLTLPYELYHYSVARGFQKMASNVSGRNMRGHSNNNITACGNGFYSANAFVVIGNKVLDQSNEPGTLMGFEKRSGQTWANRINYENGQVVIRAYAESGAVAETRVVDCPWDDVVAALQQTDKFIHCVNATDEQVILTEHNCYVFDGTQFKILLNESLSGRILTDLFKDNQGHYWACTNKGLHKIERNANPFEVLFSFAKMGIQLPLGNQVRAIYGDANGDVYVSIFKEIIKFDAQRNDYRMVTSSNGESFGFDSIGDELLAFGSMYFGKINKQTMAVSQVNPARLKPAQLDSVIATTGALWSNLALGGGRYLVGSEKGIAFLDLNNFQFRFVGACGEVSLPPAFVYRIIKSTVDQQFWAAGATGLYQLGEDYCVKEHYGLNAKDLAHELPASGFHDLYEDSEGIFWLASKDQGLVRWDRRQGTARAFGTADGFPSNLLYCILEDNSGRLWISTDRGLVRFDKKSHQLLVYSTTEGLPDNDFNRVSKFKGLDGSLYFGGVNGLTKIRPETMGDVGARAKMPLRFSYLKQAYLGDSAVEDCSAFLMDAKGFSIYPGNKYTEIGFALLDFSAPPLKYSYQIEGLDNEWIETPDGMARLSGLPYGHYVLRVKAQSHAGIWTDEAISIPFRVVRPYYHTWWFIALMVALVLALVGVYLRWRTLNLKKNSQVLEATVNNRTQALSAALGDKEVLLKEVHHRVKNNLQVISGLLDLQQRNLGDERIKAEFDIAKLRVKSVGLIHQILYENDNFSEMELLGMSKRLFEQVRAVYEGKQGRVQLVLTDEKSLVLNLNTAVCMGLLLNELMTNSFKHAFDEVADPEIRLHFSENKQQEYPYTLVYSDNGKGLPPEFDSGKINSLGFVIIKDLARQLKGKLHYSSQGGFRLELQFKGIKV